MKSDKERKIFQKDISRTCDTRDKISDEDKLLQRLVGETGIYPPACCVQSERISMPFQHSNDC